MCVHFHRVAVLCKCTIWVTHLLGDFLKCTISFTYYLLVLFQIWDLSDIDKDGHLDKEEFAVVSKCTRSGGAQVYTACAFLHALEFVCGQFLVSLMCLTLHAAGPDDSKRSLDLVISVHVSLFRRCIWYIELERKNQSRPPSRPLSSHQRNERSLLELCLVRYPSSRPVLFY